MKLPELSYQVILLHNQKSRTKIEISQEQNEHLRGHKHFFISFHHHFSGSFQFAEIVLDPRLYIPLILAISIHFYMKCPSTILGKFLTRIFSLKQLFFVYVWCRSCSLKYVFDIFWIRATNNIIEKKISRNFYAIGTRAKCRFVWVKFADLGK